MKTVVPIKQFDLFFGTGGVGKTTLATARAVSLARQGKRVLLMTIDPARRLKEVLGLADDAAGNVVPIHELPGVGSFPVPLHALLMSSQHTLARIAQTSGVPELAKNRIVSILTRPNGGMNEILAVIELQARMESGQYDCVVLDTPPGPHFLDFLEGLDKIRSFFDQRFVEIFTSLGLKAVSTSQKSFAGKIMNRMVGAGVQKLLGYLQKVTGAGFVEDFLAALEVIYRSRSAFMRGLEMEQRVRNASTANWFLVTSVEQGKAHEALAIRDDAKALTSEGMFLAVNKCLGQELDQWHPPTGSRADELKHALLEKEATLLGTTKTGFLGVLTFPEIFAAAPLEHVQQLAQGWQQYEL